MTTLLICLGAVAGLMLMSYLAASAGAERWLSPREWLGRTSCGHTHGRLLAVEYSGEAVYECVKCGKHIRRPL